MPSAQPYIPPSDPGFDTWANNFADLITAAPMTYGLVSGDATTIQGAVDAWNTAYGLVNSPSTKTPAAVADKNTQKVLALATVRPFAQSISLNAGVSSANKTAVGVNPRTSLPTPVPTPVTNPVLTIDTAIGQNAVVRYRDSTSSPSVKSKPFGAIGLQLFAAASATVISDPNELPLVGTFTKSPLQVTWQAGDRGKLAYYAGRWITRTGKVGPWSPIVTFVITA